MMAATALKIGVDAVIGDQIDKIQQQFKNKLSQHLQENEGLTPEQSAAIIGGTLLAAQALRQGMNVANAAKYIKATKILNKNYSDKEKPKIFFKHEKDDTKPTILEKAVKSDHIPDVGKSELTTLTTANGLKYYVKKVPDAKKTWEDGHFPRGRKVETVLENNLGPTFPTVDKMCWDRGIVTSIKSRDL